MLRKMAFNSRACPQTVFGGIMAAKKKIVKEQKKVVRSDEYKEKNERVKKIFL